MWSPPLKISLSLSRNPQPASSSRYKHTHKKKEQRKKEKEKGKMPAQKRSHLDDSPPLPPLSAAEEEDGQEEERSGEEKEEEEQQPPELGPKQEDDSDDEGGSGSEKDEYIFVKLADIRKEVQCPICLGIIRKTRTVMECLHRFCRECIDKSMRLGNNECPACRTHCASRRSLRDDPNYDALIAALYPDIDKYEEEELAFHEDERNRNRKIQASIAETFRRQSEALGRRKQTAKATAAAFVRKSQAGYRNSHGQNSSYMRGRGRSSYRDGSLAGSEDDEEDDANENDVKDSSSADEPSPERRQKRARRWPLPWSSSPARAAGSLDAGGEENDDVETCRDNHGASPLHVGSREMLAWGRGGVRSQIRHGNAGGSNGRFVKGGRITKLVEYIRNLEENDNEFEMHLALLPMDEQSLANLQRPFICCRPTSSIKHLCQFIALQTSVKAEELEIYARKPQIGNLEVKPSASVIKAEVDPSEELRVVGPEESLAGLRDSFTNSRGELVLMYHLKTQS